ncbi:uncharacterized protein EAE98_003311 [Botrytis deweyae]|uniref:Mpv17/PMP22 family protein n=2 Tax=Botrytis TaxID=33196 RepID=A0A4Z1JIS8_9HELO|nr:uncharacterized protein EAE98_003311 [Botrytis deweyae]KAF7925984.1 hypothetical protein EAE99_006019 [Botrytis elliptica]KAF7933602.1 hypothetical protein EAE98_003311 [Botrytis deweyae]TGO73615.1 hypothetical protein BELL_0346g00030 [Botrytis elliptica]
MPSAVVNTTVQSCVLSGISNIIAQFISAYQNNTDFTINWTPVIHFVLYGALSAPPNFYLQSLLESLLPSKKQSSPRDVSEKKAAQSKPALSVTNTILKVLIDQTLLAVLNVMLFLITFSLFRGATLPQAIQSAESEYWGMMKAGWKLWPFVSLSNFAVIKSVQGRALLGSLAGIGWNVYLGLVQGGK